MTYRKSNEPVVETTEEDDGTHHHAAYETKGPARPQEGVHLGHKDGPQSPSPASRCRQPAHVDALQTPTHVFWKDGVFGIRPLISNSLQTDLRRGSEDFGVQRVGHDVARWVSHTDQDVGGQVLSQVDGGSILAPDLVVRTARWLKGAVRDRRTFRHPT